MKPPAPPFRPPGPWAGRPAVPNRPSFLRPDWRSAPGVGPESPYLLKKAAYFFLWLFVFVIPWENALTIPGFGTVSRAVGVSALAFGILAMLEARRVRPAAFEHILAALFVGWAGLTYLWSVDPASTRIAAISFVQLLAMIWLIWEFAQTRRQQLLLLRAFVLGTVVSSCAIIWSFFSGPSTGAVGYYNRYSGFGFNPGDLALILALSLPISLYLAACDKTLRFRVGLYSVHLVLAISGILLTASRGALIASSGSLLMLPFAYSRLNHRQKVVALALVATLGAAAALVVPATSWSRLGTIGSEVRSGTLNERTMIWQAGWAVFGQSPFAGVGAAAFAPAVEHSLGMAFQASGAPFDAPSYAQLVAHNTFISVLVEQGVIGFALFMGIICTLVMAAWKLATLDRAFWLSLLVTWAIGISGLTWEQRKPSWLIFGLLIAAAHVQPRFRANQFNVMPETRFWPSGRRPATEAGPAFGRAEAPFRITWP
jgi:O-antigen ligase